MTELCVSVFQNTMAVVQSELQDLRTQFEDSLNSHENAERSLTEQVRELNQQRENAQREVRTFRNLKLHQLCSAFLFNINIVLVCSVAPVYNIYCSGDSQSTGL